MLLPAVFYPFVTTDIIIAKYCYNNTHIDERARTNKMLNFSLAAATILQHLVALLTGVSVLIVELTNRENMLLKI